MLIYQRVPYIAYMDPMGYPHQLIKLAVGDRKKHKANFQQAQGPSSKFLDKLCGIALKFLAGKR